MKLQDFIPYPITKEEGPFNATVTLRAKFLLTAVERAEKEHHMVIEKSRNTRLSELLAEFNGVQGREELPVD